MPQYTVTRACVADGHWIGNTWHNDAGVSTGKHPDGYQAYACLRFAAWGIPAYAEIVSATLSGRIRSRYTSSGFTHNIGPLTAGPFSEADGIGGKQRGTSRATAYLRDTGDQFTADATTLARAWQAGEEEYEYGIWMSSGTARSYKQLEAGATLLTVVYEVPASVPTLDRAEYRLGETVTVTLETHEAGAAHTVQYYAAGEATACQTQTLAAGVRSTSWTIPTALGAKFPNSPTAPLVVRATTTVNGATRGTISAEAIVTLPEDAAPEVSCVATRTGQTQIAAYVQKQSGATFQVVGTPRYGATISGVSVTVGNKTVEGSPAAFPVIDDGGTIPYTYRATDSRGLSTTGTGNLTVIPWEEPRITLFNIYRALASGETDIGGTYALATLGVAVSSLTAQNTLRYQVRYREMGTSVWNNMDAVAVAGQSASASGLLKVGGAAFGGFNDLLGYEFQLVATDRFASSTFRADMPTKDVLIDIFRPGKSVAIGMESTGTKENPLFEVAPKARFYGDVQVDGEIVGLPEMGRVYSTEESLTGDKWIDGKPIYRVVVTGTTTLDGAQGEFTTLPAEPESLVDLRVYVRGGNINGWRPVPNTYYAAMGWSCNVFLTGATVSLGFGSSWSGTREVILIAEYTKAEA